MVLLKSLVLVITCLSFLGILSCNGGTGSTTSSGGGGGTGTGWTITIQVGTNPLPFNGYYDTTTTLPTFHPGTNTTSVMATVRDSTGAPAPNGTQVCFTAVLNGFLEPNKTDLYATVCDPISNNLGYMVKTYKGGLYGGDTVEVASQGVIARATIHNI